MSNDPEFEYAGTNPCAEEPLPAGGSCLLGSINLAEFVIAPYTERATVDFEDFAQAVRDSVQALNEVVDDGLPLHPLEEQRVTVKELRQIGLGVMGIYDMCIKLGITYGEIESLQLSEVLSHIMINEAVKKSSLMAKEQGSFGQYKWENISDSMFFQENLTEDVKAMVKENGLRNSQILCIAPTGSISTMLGISGGIEPAFSLAYNRTTKSLHGEDKTYKVEEAIVQNWRDATGNTDEELPEMFVTAMSLDWRRRIEMQAVWQKHIDASISSTINLPKEATVDETMDLYMYAWEMGLKGATIFRDGCKRLGILTLDDDTPLEEEDEPLEEIEGVKAEGYFSTCAECGSTNTIFAEGCVTCRDCGYSPC